MRAQISLWFVVTLALAYLLPGLIGHEPWKQDETYIFGMVYHILQSGDWVVPQVAGEPFLEKPPLYYWVAAILAQATQHWLPLHDGARLASGLFSALTLIFTGLTARLWWGNGNGRYAIIALIASFGLLFESHIMITDVPMLTGFAIASYGFALSLQRPLWAGIWLGIGAGIGFLSKGLLVPGALGVTALLLPAMFAIWRRREFAQTLAIATIVALPWLLIWPIALYLRSPELFHVWFWLNNVGRFLGFSVPQLGADNSTWFWPKTLPWFAFPVLPLAIISLWQQRHRLRHSAPLQYGLIAFAVYLLVMQASASARTAYGLPMLISLTLLAIPAITALPERLNRYTDYFARLLFTPLAVISWYVWGMMVFVGKPPDWHILARGLPMDFVMPLQALPITLAVLATLGYLAAWFWLPKLTSRAVVSLSMGTTLFWILFATLWLPWVDNAKSYRGVYMSMQPHLPTQYRCIASQGLGESTRPMLEYYLGILTQRRELHPDADCDVLLIDGWAKQPPLDLAASWQLVWDGARPGDDEERFWLYVQR
ncbi:ArnT family glycosyltransferase [Sulfuriferula thiophila]|uniref:ArnT family glycosyltransferase n=1 Tax=Sulfuriferula thiophila TaxID=1781211 RepID=UPI000F60ACB3|nr:glycosyltransferase family 39 protein [Sulfuriferula thiophila]